MRDRLLGFGALCGFIATIPVANAWLNHFGLWDLPNLGPVASGVIWIGLAFVLRDLAQLILGRGWTWLAICLGITLSYFLATPALALASGASFACSETMDALIYTPLANRMFVRAVVVSGWLGSLVDSAIFMRIGFHSLSGWWQLGVVKAAIVAIATPGAYAVRKHVVPRFVAARA